MQGYARTCMDFCLDLRLTNSRSHQSRLRIEGVTTAWPPIATSRSRPQKNPCEDLTFSLSGFRRPVGAPVSLGQPQAERCDLGLWHVFASRPAESLSVDTVVPTSNQMPSRGESNRCHLANSSSMYLTGHTSPSAHLLAKVSATGPSLYCRTKVTAASRPD